MKKLFLHFSLPAIHAGLLILSVAAVLSGDYSSPIIFLVYLAQVEKKGGELQ